MAIDYLDAIKYIRTQVRDSRHNETHVVVEFVNGSRLCSCGLIRGELPNLSSAVADQNSAVSHTETGG